MVLQKRNCLAYMKNVLSLNTYALVGLMSGFLLIDDAIYYLKYVAVKEERHTENKYTEIVYGLCEN